jgi:GPH family glycoside/pentoside/hexuronide:cation symporter
MSDSETTIQNPLSKPNLPKPSFLKTISYSVADLELISSVFTMYLYIFWETEIKLDVNLVALGYTIYAIWNAINDPLVGYLTDKPRRYWAKTGKRFPLILLSSIPYGLMLVLVFNVPAWDPEIDKWKYFAWFVAFTCLFDLFFSIYNLNHNALYPDLFNTDRDRRSAGGIRMFFQLLGTLIGAVVPPMLVIFNNRASYGRMAWIFAAVGVVLFLAYLPGHIEPKELKQRYALERVKKQDSFFKTMQILLSQKNFMIYVFIFFLDSIIGASLAASIQYVVKYNLQMESGGTILVMGGFILGSLLSLFPWLFVSQKMKNNRKMLIIGILLNTVFLLPCGIFWNLPSLIVGTFLLGIGGAALRIGRTPVLADIIDETLVKSGHHMESSTMGVFVFFMRFALIAQGWIFALVHNLTGFDATADTQTELALFGIRLHTAIIPMVLCLLGLILFVKLYDLTPAKTKRIQEQIHEKQL